ncbi:hypothetical protein C8R44DRAFT_726219 [Mycena epipterygia]|nr:hypothetical protein C8R44DRAFT_726219 [Mycena epipterygia]
MSQGPINLYTLRLEGRHSRMHSRSNDIIQRRGKKADSRKVQEIDQKIDGGIEVKLCDSLKESWEAQMRVASREEERNRRQSADGEEDCNELDGAKVCDPVEDAEGIPIWDDSEDAGQCESFVM